MSQQLNLDGWIKLAEHQRRISGTEMGVGEYIAPPPQPKGCSSRDRDNMYVPNGSRMVTHATIARMKRGKKRSYRDPFNKRIELLAKSAKKVFR